MDTKVIRAPSLKRGKNDGGLNERIKLKKVLGLTVCSNAALDVSPTNGVLAYPAGCTVVLFNSKKLSQSYLLNTSRKAITAIAYSQCGRYIATGECGQSPAIKVWELDATTTTTTSNGTANNNNNGININNIGGSVVAEFPGHKYAISCIAFSPTGKYLVSVGSQHDMIVNVFDWKINLKIASNKVSAKVVAVCFSEDGNYFVTVGNRHVKYWYLEGSRKYKEPIPLMGRSAILGELRNNDFCAVACGKGETADSTFAITRNGQLVEFNSRRLLDKWVACRTTSANCLCTSSKYILVGCAESIIRVFNAETLEYMTTLPRTHYLGADVAQGIHISHITAVPKNAKFPDTIAMVYDEARSKVSCVYNDHSLYIWDLRDIRRVGKSHSFLYHSACIWGVETVPFTYVKNQQLTNNLPSDCFLTCSSDDTIRVWDLNDSSGDNSATESINDVYRRNIYSKELLKVLYIDDELNFIKDIDNPILNMEKPASYDGRNGVRCIKISPDRQHLATGDRSGNIRIYNLANLKLITTIEAHDSEVLCLEYTNDKIERKMLASASRDRLIHIFDVENSYRILQTLDDHSSSITSVKFIGIGSIFQMVSCGADKSIIFRTFQNGQFLRGNNCSGKNTLYDMEIDSNSKHILTACQDRNIRIYGTQNAKHTKTFKGSHSDEGSLIKLSLDLSGIYIATSCTDKTLSVYDYYSTECMARMYGHSELVTGLKFTNDCKHLISASGDGCIFVWQVPHDMIVTMQARLSQQALRSGHPTIARPLSIEPAMCRSPEEFGSPPANFLVDDIPTAQGYKFSDVGQLPQWAKKKSDEPASTSPPLSSTVSSANALSSSPSQTQFGGVSTKPRGRWAQRGSFEPDALELRTADSPNSSSFAIPTPAAPQNNQTSDYNSGSSKDVYNHTSYLSEDSSIDSGMENRRELMFLAKNDEKILGNVHFESNTEHDGDVEDISDGERTSSDHGMMFYPTIAPSTPTDFKVNAMNEEELRKSVRRQKFERQGLSFSAPLSGAPSTGTGTGTSDDEDEGSTPSGDNAERSLASTLGGSSESIPAQASSSFLQAALDGPGSLSDRGERTRRSISAKHNTDNNKNNNSFSKSFSNTKKEELMKVINEAKQKLENVGYRSNLRASQSISDLSHTANMDARLGKIGRSGDKPVHHHTTTTTISNTNNYYLNCAAPKSVLTQNCNIVRQLQRDYPPYPCDIGIYHNQPVTTGSTSATPSTTLNSLSQTQSSANITQSTVCSNLKNRPKTLELPLFENMTTASVTSKPLPPIGPRHPSILKHYKSCPVSPVHEEQDWSNLSVQQQQLQQQTQSTQSSSATKSSVCNDDPPKRHSMYSEDAETILDMIHLDTEKMIAEITSKYGDLDDYDPGGGSKPSIALPKSSSAIELHKKSNVSAKPKEPSPDDEAGNFSSDSLEDCSLDLDLSTSDQRHRYKKNRSGVCKKHSRRAYDQNTFPKRSQSDYFIYDQLNLQRNISLSDILNEDENKENIFLSTQRHSSASFFLGPNAQEKKSQESLLSDEMSGGGVSYCNSMESILSDDSECRSAPLEVLFSRTKRDLLNNANRLTGTLVDANKCSTAQDYTSKSYGSSPNASMGFDYYMQNHFATATDDHRTNQYDVSGYGYESLLDNRYTVDKSPSHTIYSSSSVAKSLSTSNTYPWLPNDTNPQSIPSSDGGTEEFIPRLGSKNIQYGASVSKSLSKEFADHRQNNNSNPMFDAPSNSSSGGVGFSGGSGKQQKPQPPKPIKRIDIFAADPSIYVMKKSCSFDIEMSDGRRTQRSTKKYVQNLEKFEKDRKQAEQYGGTLDMDYVPHKPPVANRRTSSVKNRRSSRDKDRYHTVGQIECEPRKSTTMMSYASEAKFQQSVKGKSTASSEKSFEIYIAEKGATEDDNMDSLELYTKSKLQHKENSVDSLDDIGFVKQQDNRRNPLSSVEMEKSSIVSSSFLTEAEYMKFRDIEKKIDVINKLVEMEEKKLEQERLSKENRMRPFQCNAKEKGYVKSLTMNFDKLARRMQDEVEFVQHYHNASSSGDGRMKRNFSLPDVLEGAKYQAFNFDEDLLNRIDTHNRRNNNDDTADDDGNPKSLLSANQNDDSSAIRRACSLSDLSMGKGFKGSSTSNPSNYKPLPSSRQNTPSRSPPKRTNSTVGKTTSSSTLSVSNSGMGTRSISVGTLNQASDSDPEALATRGGVMRPTIASQNKANGGSAPSTNRQYNNSKTAAGIINRRRGLSNSYSSVNLSTAGQDDSSSEEAQSIPPNTGKPAVPPRPRSISIDHKRINGIPGVVTGSPLRSKVNNFDDTPCKDIDVDNADITSQLCSNIISQLMVTTNSVMQLHQRLKHSDEQGGARHKNLMLKELENAVIMTQSMLTKVTNNRSTCDNNNGSSTTSSGGIHVTFHSNATDNRSTTAITQNGGNNDYGQMMDKCSDMLHKVQKHVQNQN